MNKYQQLSKIASDAMEHNKRMLTTTLTKEEWIKASDGTGYSIHRVIEEYLPDAIYLLYPAVEIDNRIYYMEKHTYGSIIELVDDIGNFDIIYKLSIQPIFDVEKQCDDVLYTVMGVNFKDKMPQG